MQNKCVVVIHGPYKANAYKKIFTSILKNLKYLKSIFKNVEVIVSTYIKDKEETEEILKEYRTKLPLKFIYCKDLLNPGYFNINRHVYSVSMALNSVENDSLIIKLRNDQWINWKKLIYILKKYNYLNNITQKIITTNCFTRKDRLYHPSDMFMCGWKSDLQEYFSMPLMKDTHLNCQLKMLNQLRNTNDKFYSFLISPESELFKNYLKLKGWDIKNTYEDSYNALNKFILLINTWDIELRWNKQRNADLPAGTIILPYTFNLEPFAGAPKEKAICYSRHDFLENKTVKDIMFLKFSKIVFDYKYKFKVKVKWLFKHCVRMIVIILVNILPFYFAKRLAKFAYAPSLKNEIKILIKKTPVFKIYKVLKNK